MAIMQRILKNLLSDPSLSYRIELTPEAYPYVEGMTPKELYATQANLQAVVSFLADSIAQLPVKVYKRNDETKRERDRDSVAARLLWLPNSDQTSYELWNSVMIEYYLYGTAILWHLPDPYSNSGHQLRLLPRDWITDSEADSAYALKSITVSARGGAPAVKVPKEDFIQFKMYSPGEPGSYQSPVSALKNTLMEQIQADKFRTQIWRSSGRFNAYITRPKDVAPWDDETKKRWVEAFRAGWGSDGGSAGKMPLLEDGMEIKPYQFNAEQAQYAETKQLSREDVAAAYHVNPSLIWHTSTQTYASAKDNARALYADCLGPTIQMLQQRINSFLLPMVGADPGTYVVFDLGEKLKGSFEERASILQSAVGGPYMTRNEARADSDLPPIEGGDELIVPMNVNNGIDNPAVEENTSEELKRMQYAHVKASDTRMDARSTEKENEAVAETIRKFVKRQAKSLSAKIGAGGEWWNEDRWNAELTEDMLPVIDEISAVHGQRTAKKLGTEFNTEITQNYLKALTEGRSKAINVKTKRDLDEALESEDPEEEIKHTFEKREGNDADLLGENIAKTVALWAVGEACNQAKEQGQNAEVLKVWRTGDNPREDHAVMDGETVPIDEPFSNGADWPGDDVLGPDGTCGCNCSVEIIFRRR
jgi:HK97 family phage portal protein